MAEKEVKSHSISSNNLEQFVLLAKSARGAGLVALVKQVLEAPGVFVFGELLEMPNVEEVNCCFAFNLVTLIVTVRKYVEKNY